LPQKGRNSLFCLKKNFLHSAGNVSPERVQKPGDHREEFLSHYHKRSNVETTFHMIKSKFGQRLRSKTMTAQINEALCKVLCHNLCVVIHSQHELEIETDSSMADAA
jgi:transposase